MEIARFSECPPGTLSELLLEACAANAELTRRHRDSWRAFDAFVFDHLAIMDANGLVTLADGAPIGFISWDSRPLPDYVEIGHNCIRPAYQGAGRGRAQLLAALARIRALHPRRVIVRTGADPFFLPARRMYESAGFSPRGIIRREDAHVPEVVEYALEL
jgi:GNAT superfamily N-acetyltransferase